MVNEPSRFELLRFDCICYNQTSGSSKFLDNMLLLDVSESPTILHSQYLVYNNSEDRAFPLDILIDVHEQRISRAVCMSSESACVSLFVCVEVLRLSQPNGVMSSAVSLSNHTFTWQT